MTQSRGENVGPPLVETVLGVQFTELKAFTLAHCGLFWSSVEKAYPTIQHKERLLSTIELREPFVPYGTSIGYGPEMPHWLDWVRGEFKNVAGYKDGWDGDGSVAPSPAVLEGAFGFLMSVGRVWDTLPCPFIDISPRGRVMLVWKNEKQSLDIQIENNGELLFLLKDRVTGKKDKGRTTLNAINKSILDAVRNFA